MLNLCRQPVACVPDACRVCLNTLERVSNLFSRRFSLLASILSLLQAVLQGRSVGLDTLQSFFSRSSSGR